MTKYSLLKTATFLKALSEPNRLRIWVALQDQALCLCHLTGMLNLAASTVSKHTHILQKAGCLSARKKGKWTYFKAIADPQFSTWLSLQKLDTVAELNEDAQYLQKIKNKECL